MLISEEEWPSPTPPYVDTFADLHDDLVAGKAVNVKTWMLGRGEVPPGCRLVRVNVDGTISPAGEASVGP